MFEINNLSLWIPLLPMIGALIWGYSAYSDDKIFKQHTKKVVSFGAPLAVLIPFFIGLGYFFKILSLPTGQRAIHEVIFPWISTSHFSNNIAFFLDQLSIIMVLVVSGISFLIHVYSIGYMEHDPGFSRFFSYLNLFTGMMLILVMGDNILLMFVGWEGVGLCSYLLIGFWFQDINNAKAGMKAFVVNRIGDFAFITGVLTMFWVLGNAPNGVYTFDFQTLNSMASVLAGQTVVGFKATEVIAVLFFIGATGKSAQIPLHVWLPDAMAGPTPVSALIHAATMVTAGVFMIGRLGGIFLEAPNALVIIAIIGGVTSFFAATIAITQFDIKRVLAYSTVSQLGYMFLAMGMGSFSAGIFHLVTHAFFKALLFLGSGSVILGMHHEQDMRRMGGLHAKMKYTGITFLIGVMAITGVAPLSGFFSKDEILFKTFIGSAFISKSLYVLGLTTAFITAFYMFRQYFMTFRGTFRGIPKSVHHEESSHHDDNHGHGAFTLDKVHESPAVMTTPLIILAVFSVIAGFLNLPESMGGGAWFHHWLAPIWPVEEEAHSSHSLEILLALLSFGIAIISIGFAYLFYMKNTHLPETVEKMFPVLHRLSFNKYFIDEIYEVTFVKPTIYLSKGISIFDKTVIDGLVNGLGTLTVWVSKINGWIDTHIVDGAVNGAADIIQWSGDKIRKTQTGYLYNYLSYVLGGVIVITVYLVFK